MSVAFAVDQRNRKIKYVKNREISGTCQKPRYFETRKWQYWSSLEETRKEIGELEINGITKPMRTINP